MAQPKTEARVMGKLQEGEALSLTAQSWLRLKQNRLAYSGFWALIFLCSLCFLGPFFTEHKFSDQNLAIGATPPSAEHWFGTDDLGRDLLARVLVGGRVSFLVGFLATFVALIIGVAYGSIAGWFGGWLDRVMMRCVDILYAMPFTIFVILLMVFFGRHLWLIFVAIGAVEWLTMSRIVRGQILKLKSQTFVEASLSLGQRPLVLIRKHLLPNLLGLVIVYATLTVPSVMLLEAFISFLGLGVQPPMTSWGDLIGAGADNMEEYPWMLFFPSLFFFLTLFSLNFLGDGLRDAFDPRTERR